MTYTTITGASNISDLLPQLNGVTTRTVDLSLSTGPVATGLFKATAGVSGWELTINDDVSFNCQIPPRVDTALGATLRLLIAPITSEASKSVKLEVACDPIGDGESVVLATGGVTGNTGDVAVSGTTDTAQVATISLGSTVWGGHTTGFLAGTIKRVAISAGTELTADVSLVAASLTFTIER